MCCMTSGSWRWTSSIWGAWIWRWHFLDWYREYSAETHPPSLEHHYIAYRALVRAKISCLRGGAGDEAEARAFLAQCQRHLLDARVQLVVDRRSARHREDHARRRPR